MKLLVAVAAFFIASATAHATGPVAESPVTSVAMEQFECFWGTCPHYVVAINSDGTGSYVGLTVAKKRGGVSFKLQSSAFDRIVREINKINYFSLKERYASKDDGCNEVWSDQSAVTFYITRGNKTKVVTLYYGCKMPVVTENLRDLAKLIDKVSGMESLLGRGQ